jgi:RHS repeat-associated protein
MMQANKRLNRVLAGLVAGCLTIGSVSPVLAGGYVDSNVVLRPATAINTGAVSVTPTFNNDQFNDKLLIGTVNNDPIRTPSTADPVSTVTGNNYHDETDLVIRGRNGLNTVFTRTYNSAPSSTTVDRGMGFGWTHSYLMRLKSNDFGDCPNCTSTQKPENGNNKTSSVTYTDERGGDQNYLVNETSFSVTSPKGVYDTLALDSPAVGQHTLSFRNGVKYIFETPSGSLKSTPNVVARLKFVDNAWGDRLTLSYDGAGRLSSVTDNLGISGRSGIVFTYDGNGRMKDVTDWTARKWSFAYDAAGNLQSMTNPLTQVLTYSYEVLKHLLTSISKPLLRDGKLVQTKFKYYENGRTFQQTNSFDVGDTLDYDLYRKSTRVTDARGFIRQYYYDDNGRMTKLVEPDGAVLLFENQGDAIRSKKFDALGYATTYSYRADKALTGTSDQFGNVTRELDALNRTVDMTYGPFDQVATTKDKRGTISTTIFGSTISGCDYTNRPKETRVSALAGSSNVLMASLCWNSNATPNYSRTYFDNIRYRETRLTYEPASNGLNVSQEQMVGMPSGITITKTYTYDSLGRKKTETLKRRAGPTNTALINLTTSYDYDALDRVVKATDSLGNEVINNFDANGQLWKVTHRYKNDTVFDVRDIATRTFDAADRIKTETNAIGNLTTYTYDESGNVIAVLDAEGHTTRFEYDPMNRKTASVDATGYRNETILSLRGDVLGARNANDEKVSFEIDALGRKTAAIDARGYRSEFSYDENGNLTCFIDANAVAGLQPRNTFNCSEFRVYDELNRVTKIVDALNGETSFTYDFAGNRLTVKDAENKTWRFAYDDLGRLSSETDHSAKVTSYKQDEAGNVYEKTNRLNEITRATYDNGNRLTRVDYLKDNSLELFSYDAAGNRYFASNVTVVYLMDYDRLNRLTRKDDSRGQFTTFSYDGVGNMLTKTTFQGSKTSYVYNAANRLVMLRNPDYTQVDYQYDPAGRLLSRVTAAGARTSYQYDANGWLTKLAQFDAANNGVSDTSYTRDRVGNILTQADTVGAGTGTTTFTMDALYRLATADYPGTVNDERFTYDKVGNRKTYTKGSLVANASTRYYNHDPGTNRLQDVRVGSAGGALESSFFYDFEGRLTNQTGPSAKAITWDAKGRVRTVSGETYTYDPMDYRIGRTGGSVGAREYFLEGEHLESEYSGSQLRAKYFRGSTVDELVGAWMTDTDGKLKPFLFHQDQVTSTSAVTGHNGGTTQSIKYAAFGTVQSSTGASPNRNKYTGREDDGTGLMYYRARYYDASLGRFISEDPLGYAAGDVNFYQYTSNNPINANDPSGNFLQFVPAIVTAARAALTVVNASRTATAVSQATTIGAGTSVAVGGAIRGATGQPVLDTGAISFDATIGGVFGVGGQAYNAIRVAGSSSFAKGTFANSLAKTQLGDSVIGTEISVLAGGARPRLDFLTQSGSNLVGVEAKYGSAALTTPQSIGYGAINAGEASSLFGARAAASGVSGMPVSSVNVLRFGPLDGVPTVSSYLGGALGGAGANGGFLLYPNKVNTNQMQSVYSK